MEEYHTKQIKKLENEIKAKNEKIEMLLGAFNNSWIGLTIADGKGKSLMLNPAHQRISGLDPNTHIGRNYEDIEKENKNTSCTMEVVRQGRAAQIQQILKSGRRYLVYGTPYSDPSNNKSYIVCNLVDSTEVNRSKQDIAEEDEDIRENKLLKFSKIDQESIKRKIIYKSDMMKNVLKVCSKIAEYDSTVMILGDSGTGKELLADFIVSKSKRSEQPFIKVNCAAIPDALLESELFGYEGGSFTNASSKGKRGIFEIADRGTVMLDEIGEMPLNLQSKLLRFLQEKEIFHIGGLNPITVNVRVIAATNLDLKKLVKQKQFRKDLYYRLNVVPVKVPPLSERAEDIPPLIWHFLDKYNEEYGLDKQFSFDLVEYLKHRNYEGNVRELQNYIERIVLLSEKDVISLEDLDEMFDLEDGVKKYESGSLKYIMDECEHNILINCMNECNTITEASKILGISQPTLSRKLAYHGIVSNQDDENPL